MLSESDPGERARLINPTTSVSILDLDTISDQRSHLMQKEIICTERIMRIIVDSVGQLPNDKGGNVVLHSIHCSQQHVLAQTYSSNCKVTKHTRPSRCCCINPTRRSMCASSFQYFCVVSFLLGSCLSFPHEAPNDTTCTNHREASHNSVSGGIIECPFPPKASLRKQGSLQTNTLMLTLAGNICPYQSLE